MADNKFQTPEALARCLPMSRLQAVLSGKWKILILWYVAFYRVQRFGALLRRLDGITQSTLTRTEVRGGGRKPWRQKGTGRARQGSIRSPQWTKGGVVFAPKSRDFSKKMNVTAKRIALFSALSQKIRDDEVVFIEDLKVAAPKTKEVVKMLDAFKLEKSVLIVTNGKDEDLVRAANNLEKVTTVPVELINTYDVVKNAKVVISKEAAQKLEEVYGA